MRGGFHPEEGASVKRLTPRWPGRRSGVWQVPARCFTFPPPDRGAAQGASSTAMLRPIEGKPPICLVEPPRSYPRCNSSLGRMGPPSAGRGRAGRGTPAGSLIRLCGLGALFMGHVRGSSVPGEG